MADKEEKAFDRSKVTVTANVNFVRGGAVGTKGQKLEGKNLAKLSDEDLQKLEAQKIVSFANGEAEPSEPEGETKPEGEAKPKGGTKPKGKA